MRQSKDVSFIHIIDYVRPSNGYLILYVCVRIVKNIDVDRKKITEKRKKRKEQTSHNDVSRTTL